MNVALLAVALSSPASATEVVWDGYYRARGLIYDSLSLSDTNPYAEGTANTLDHRFRLAPSWLLSEHAALHAQVDFFPYTLWGGQAATYEDPLTGVSTASAFTDGVTTTGAGLFGVRAWGEATARFGDKAYGTVSFGRMPMEWGAGILWNPGDAPDAEYGDTADRLQFVGNFGQAWVMTAWDVQHEGFLGAPDDMQGATLALGYKAENAAFALLNHYRYQPSMSWNGYTGDAWGYSQLGPVRFELEVAGTFGGGDLETGQNGVDQMAFGGMLDVSLRRDPITVGLEAGFATGDADTSDNAYKAFSFDRDHDVALMLFEEALPTLASAVANDTNGGRTTEAALTGDGVSNALYLRPRVAWQARPDVRAELAWVTATAAKLDPDVSPAGGYGHEVDVSLRYDPFPHVWAEGTFGVLLPGKFYSEYTHPDLGGGFDRPAVGGRILATVEF